MAMRSDVDHDERRRPADATDGSAAADCIDSHEPPVWPFGSRIATRNVQATRKAYFRYAEVAERVLNDVDSTTSRMSKGLWAAASGAREALLQMQGAAATSPRARGREPVRRGAAAVRANLSRSRAELRDIALRGQIAADTNMRAYLDHLDELAKAPSARKLMSTQTTFFWDQWQRSLQQTFDLHQRTVGALRKIASAPTT